MQFTSKLTKEDYNEFRKMSGADSNLAMMVIYPVGLAFMFLRFWKLTSIGVAKDPSTLPYFVLGWGAAVAFIAWTWIYRGRQRVKALEQMNALRPDTITFTETGLDCTGPAGATMMVPWQHFTGWREGKRVLLLKFGGAKRYTILPVSQLPDREPIRQFLKLHIPQMVS